MQLHVASVEFVIFGFFKICWKYLLIKCLSVSIFKYMMKNVCKLLYNIWCLKLVLKYIKCLMLSKLSQRDSPPPPPPYHNCWHKPGWEFHKVKANMIILKIVSSVTIYANKNPFYWHVFYSWINKKEVSCISSECLLFTVICTLFYYFFISFGTLKLVWFTW